MLVLKVKEAKSLRFSPIYERLQFCYFRQWHLVENKLSTLQALETFSAVTWFMRRLFCRLRSLGPTALNLNSIFEFFRVTEYILGSLNTLQFVELPHFSLQLTTLH